MSDSPLPVSLNPAFLRNLEIYFKDDAKSFLRVLPSRIKHYEALWKIKVLPPFPNLSINYVAPAIGENSEAYVFKCAVPNPEFNTEVDTLCFMNGQGLPKLINYSKEDAVLIQERILSGVSLRGILKQGKLNDIEATEIAAVAMKAYFQQASKPIPNTYSFPHISDWLAALEKPNFQTRKALFPKELIERTDVLLPDLLASLDTPILLHGDLHHDNIVSHNSHGSHSSHSNDWMVIDPKGIIGEASFEIRAFLSNPQEILHYTDLKSTMQKRIEIFSNVLSIDTERIMAWMIVQSVLSIWWNIESDGSIQNSHDLYKASKIDIVCALAVCDLM